MNISRIGTPLRACLIGLVAIIGAGTVSAVTPATKVEFEGFAHSCGCGPIDIKVTPGGQTIHVRDGFCLGQWVTGNALIDGYETVTSHGEVTPKGLILHLFRTLEPDAYPGSSWEIVQTEHIKPDGSTSSHAVGHATGALKGMTIKFTELGRVLVPNPCPDLNSGLMNGVILAPANNN